MVTLKDLSTACGVSTATVSRALNNQNDVSKKTAERIRRLAQEMGYCPNAAARALKTNRTYNIGILYENTMDHEYFCLIIDTIRHTAEQCGYDITFLCNTIGDSSMNYYDHAKYRGLDGIIIVQGDFSSPEIKRLALSEFPCVVLDYLYSGCDCIGSDNRAGVEKIVRHAFSLGHRKIAFIHGDTGGSVTDERISGFRSACTQCGLSVPDAYIVSAHYHMPDASKAATRQLMNLPEPPTCILYPDDYACLGGISELEKMGLRVPEDISIVGYDGIHLASILRPKLTTYRQDYEKIGQLAVSVLMDAIENPESHQARTVTVNGCMTAGGTLTRVIAEDNM